jgi:phospholipid transport system substrate-binding protein
MRHRHFLRAIFLGLSVTTLSLAASADVAGAQAFVEKEHGIIKKLVDANAPVAEVTKAIDGMIDYDEIAQRALGKPCPTTIPQCTNHWDTLNDAQKREVRDLYKALVEKKYRENAYKTKDFDVSYRGAKETSPDVTKVRTEAKNKTKPREPPVQVDYMIRSSGATHKVVDYAFEGSLVTKNYYESSDKIMKKDGYQALVNKLREKVNTPAKK